MPKDKAKQLWILFPQKKDVIIQPGVVIRQSKAGKPRVLINFKFPKPSL